VTALLTIERGAAMVDILALLGPHSPKLNPATTARLQSRSTYAWTWRRPDRSPAICAGMAQTRPAQLERLETWFACKPDLTTGELHEFILFSRLVLWCVWRDRRPIEFIAWVGASTRSAGARIARLAGFKLDPDPQGGQRRVIFNPESEELHNG
jgi:hypothetical protein